MDKLIIPSLREAIPDPLNRTHARFRLAAMRVKVFLEGMDDSFHNGRGDAEGLRGRDQQRSVEAFGNFSVWLTQHDMIAPEHRETFEEIAKQHAPDSQADPLSR